MLVFLVGAEVPRFPSTRSVVAAPDICCPGTNCNWRKNSLYQCACQPDARSTQSAACSDPQGTCSKDQYLDSLCPQFGVGCPEFRVGPCVDAPAPCPSTDPSNCPSGKAVDSCTWDNPPGIEDGCEPLYHPEGACLCSRSHAYPDAATHSDTGLLSWSARLHTLPVIGMHHGAFLSGSLHSERSIPKPMRRSHRISRLEF